MTRGSSQEHRRQNRFSELNILQPSDLGKRAQHCVIKQLLCSRPREEDVPLWLLVAVPRVPWVTWASGWEIAAGRVSERPSEKDPVQNGIADLPTDFPN